MNLSLYRSYNGVNHDLNVYNSYLCVANRKNQYFLSNPNILPMMTLRQNKPLSIHTCLTPQIGSDNLFFLPEAYNSQLDTVPNYCDYDMIIVSSTYAALARQTLNNVDYLDRLYTVVPVYQSDPAITHSPKVGCIGFKKVCFSRHPNDYVIELRSGRLPSISAMETCLNLYKNSGSIPDFTTQSLLRELENHLKNIRTNYTQIVQ